jgi:hypothetical protein
MTKKTRTILFSFLVIFFFFMAAIAIFYAQGLRFDFKNFKVLKTGGISVKASPINAKVFLNQKLAGQIALMSDYVFVQGLLPKTYEVRVEKEGYMPWSKNLEVEETKVTEAKSVVLFPQNIHFNGGKSGIEKIYPLNGDKLVLQYQSSKNSSGRISIYDLNKEEETVLAGINAFLTDNDLLDLKVLDAQDLLFLLKNKKSEKTNYFLIDLDAQDLSAQKLGFIGENSDSILLASSFSDKILFWLEDETIFKRSLAANTANETSQKFSVQKTAAFTLSDGYFYILSENGDLSRIDQNKNFPSQQLTGRPFEIKNAKNPELSVLAGQVFLKDDGDLYALDEKERSFKKIFEGVEELKASPFEDKLLCQLQNELWIYALKDMDAPSQEKAGTKIFISRFSQQVQKSDWIDDNYFAFSTTDKINISETDIRSNLNMYEIASLEGSELWFNQKNGKLYILSEGTLLVSDKLLSK